MLVGRQPPIPGASGIVTALSVKVVGLRVRYAKAALALSDVSFEAEAGQSIGIIGANGAGKTTTMRCLSGFLPSDRAHIDATELTIGGKDVKGVRPDRLAHRGISLVPERDKIFTDLTVEENLKISTIGRRSSDELKAREELLFDLFPILRDRSTDLSGYLSGGQRQQLAIASALLTEPQLLLIDEMSLGLAPSTTAQLVAALRTINSELGVTMIVVEQNIHVAAEVASYLYVLDDGQIALEGSADEVSRTGVLSIDYRKTDDELSRV